MKTLLNKKNIYTALYIAALFAVIYSCKYLIDALAYAVTNLGSLLSSLTETAGRILGIFTIVVLGFVIAYVLDPIVTFFQKKLKFDRLYSVTLLYLLLFLLIAAAVFGVIRKISIYDSNDLTNAFSLAYIHYKTQFSELYNKFYTFVSHYDFLDLFSSLAVLVGNTEFDCLKAAQCVGKWTANTFLSLIIAFYFLKDKKHILYSIKRCCRLLIPHKMLYIINNGLLEIHTVFSGYIRGQLTDAVLMSVLIASALSILRIPFAVAIGVISGFTNIIPFFGAIAGFLLSTVTALISHGVLKATAAAVTVLIIQQIDSIIIVPRVVGEKVSLSPVMVIIALGIAGNLFGIWGMVFAVPVTAIGKIFLEKNLRKLEINELKHLE